MLKAEINEQAVKLLEFLAKSVDDKGIISPYAKLDITADGENTYRMRHAIAGHRFEMVASIELVCWGKDTLNPPPP